MNLVDSSLYSCVGMSVHEALYSAYVSSFLSLECLRTTILTDVHVL